MNDAVASQSIYYRLCLMKLTFSTRYCHAVSGAGGRGTAYPLAFVAGREWQKVLLKIHVKHTVVVAVVVVCKPLETDPQCFMFCGLSIRVAILILRFFAGQFLVVSSWYHSGTLELVAVGLSNTWQANHTSHV